MKRIASLCVLFTISLIGCKDKPDTKASPQPHYAKDSLTLKDSLIGKWGGRAENRPMWDIRKDSIYYFDRSIAYPYKIINRDFIIYFPDHKAVLRNIKVDHDTIFFFDEIGLVRGYRSKE